ncbi:MHS family MFS transporter [Microbacterium sp. P26]|uniref:MFS transporter n=1 Tax=Microbacterium TaxID=33882 RepID=UPI00203E6E66|nr:MFS transporter [Microbacterium sp. P26]MCM3503115.1 MHS family MFS transporter [Microbacterium sp. P26]
MQTSPQLDRKVTTSAVVGTIIEWYDFYIYGTASALVFGMLFFHADDPLVGTIAAFATFAIGFLARPIGAAVFGHFGDRIGRKKMLIYSLVGMGIATVAVGLLPTYDQVGALAPILLVACRLIQGFCVGGEWGGAMLLSVEHAPAGKKNLAGALVQVGSPAGLVLATGILAIFSAQPDEVFLTWGWRVPFLFSALLVAIGLFIRLKVDESPEFKKVREAGQTTRIPLFATFAKAPLQVLAGIALTCGPFVYFYFLTTFLLTFGVSELGFDRQTLLLSVTIAATVEIALMPVAGWLADKYGRGKVFTIGAALLVVLAFPAVAALIAAPGDTAVLLIVMVGSMSIIHPLTYALLSTMFTDLFPAGIRYTGVSLAFQFGGVVGGFSPLILTAALTTPSFGILIPGYLALMSIITLVAGIAVTRQVARTRQLERV